MNQLVARPFLVIRDTAELYGWTVKYNDFGVGHDQHVLTLDGSVIVVNYRSRMARSCSYSGPHDVDRTIGDGIDPPVVDVVTGWLKAYGHTPDTARVAWSEWTGGTWYPRVTDPQSFTQCTEFADFLRSQRLIEVSDIRMKTTDSANTRDNAANEHVHDSIPQVNPPDPAKPQVRGGGGAAKDARRP